MSRECSQERRFTAIDVQESSTIVRLLYSFVNWLEAGSLEPKGDGDRTPDKMNLISRFSPNDKAFIDSIEAKRDSTHWEISNT